MVFEFEYTIYGLQCAEPLPIIIRISLANLCKMVNDPPDKQ